MSYREMKIPILVTTIIGAASLAVAIFFHMKKKSKSAPKRAEVARVSELNIYPVKSCAPIKVDTATCTKWGLYLDDCKLHDRQFMVADKRTGEFISARTRPTLVLVKPRIDGDNLVLSAPGMENDLSLPICGPTEKATRSPVSVWGNNFSALDCGDEAADWFSKYLAAEDLDVRFFYFKPESCHRKVEKNEGPLYHRQTRPIAEHAVTMFADGYPYLLASESSIDKLNGDAGNAIATLKNFRPNITVTGSDAYQEDSWRDMSIGEVNLFNEKMCGRCRFPNVNPDTGMPSKIHEPFRTLIKTRRKKPFKDTVPLFGINLILDGTAGKVKVGDSIFATLHISEK